MFSSRRSLVAILVTALVGAPAVALRLGDPAPPLKIQQWLKGKPVDLKEGKGKSVYVIDFWSTTSVPSTKVVIPYLTKLQKKYKDQGVVIVGVTGKEAQQDLAEVTQFVEKTGAGMDYPVGFDDGNATQKAYMGGFNRSGIPQAFLVDKEGKVVWEGHPAFGLGEVLDAVLSGKYDPQTLAGISKKAKEKSQKKKAAGSEAAKRAQQAEAKVNQYVDLLSTGVNEDIPRAQKLGEEILKTSKDDPRTLNELAWRILTEESIQKRDLDLALRAAKAAYEVSKGEDPGILDTYARALWENGRKDEAIKYQQKAVDLAKDPKMKADLEKTLREYQKKK